MRIRLFAAVLLAPLVMGACDGNPIGAGAPLVGAWESDALQLPGAAPNGSTNALYRESWSFRDDGTYSRSHVIIDGTTGLAWVTYAEAGSWRAQDDELRRAVRETFSLVEPAPVPEERVLVPIAPQAVRARYELEGSILTIFPYRPPNAMCVAPLPLHPAPVAQ